MAFVKRNFRKIVDLPYNTTTGFVQIWAYASADALAVIMTAGYFNEVRDRLRVNDQIMVMSAADAIGDALTLKLTSVPASGNVLVGADDDQNSVGAARAVVPTADGLTTGLILASDSFVTLAAANAAHWATLPAIADVPLGKEIWGKNGATACELRTPATSGTKINGTAADSTEAVIAANVTLMVKKVAADEWALLTFTGGAVAAPTPD